MSYFPTGTSLQAANAIRERQRRRRLGSNDPMGSEFDDIGDPFRQRPRATPSTPMAPAAQSEAPQAAARRRPGQTPLEAMTRQAAAVMGSEPVQRRIGQRDALGLNRPGVGGSVNPSGPALLARSQRESQLRGQGVDPMMLREELNRRRTTDAALIRQRRALGRKAQLLEAQGDRVGAEQVRAEIELLEGSRREAAGDTARSSALLRGGESRLQDTDTIAMIRRNQDVTRRRNALGEQAEDLDLTIAGRGLEARDFRSQTDLTGARVDLREAGLADTVSERTLGARADAGVLGAENELASLRAQEAELTDAVQNGQGDRDAERELRRVQLRREQTEARLADARAASELTAEEATGPARVDAATDAAAVAAIRARQERQRLEGGAANELDVITAVFGEGATPEERGELVATIRADVEAIRTMNTDRDGLRGVVNFAEGQERPVSTEDNIAKVRTLLDNLATRRAAFTPEQYEAYVGFIRSELLREAPQWAATDSPFVNSLMPTGVGGAVGTVLAAGTPIGPVLGAVRGRSLAKRRTDEANSMWARLRAELGLSA